MESTAMPLIILLIGAIIALLNLLYALINKWKALFFARAQSKLQILWEEIHSNRNGVENENAPTKYPAYDWFLIHKSLIKERLKEADVRHPISRLTTHLNGEILKGDYDLIEFPNAGGYEQMALRLQTLRQAEGHYNTRAKLQINPLHWLDVLLNMPLKLLVNTDVNYSNSPNALVKAINLIYQSIIALTVINEFLGMFDLSIQKLIS